MTARAWQRMLSGRRLDLLDPSPLDVEIEDIAHGLAFVARWNGQTRGEHPYSVAEHSLLVEELYGRIVPRPEARWRLAALLHDAPEYVIGDMISPVKAAVGPGYAAMDARLARAVHLRFGLPAELPARGQGADQAGGPDLGLARGGAYRGLRGGGGEPLLRGAAGRGAGGDAAAAAPAGGGEAGVPGAARGALCGALGPCTTHAQPMRNPCTRRMHWNTDGSAGLGKPGRKGIRLDAGRALPHVRPQQRTRLRDGERCRWT